MATPLQTMARLHLDRHPEEAARVLERLSPDAIAAVLQEAPAESAAGVLACFAPSLAAACLAGWPEGELSAVVALLPAPIAAAVLRQLEPRVREAALGGLPATVRVPLSRALSYPDQSAGALADPAVLTFHVDLTVEEALTRLSQSRGPVAARLFVLDRAQRLLGVVTPGQLLSSRRDAPLTSLELSPAQAVPDRVGVATLRAISAESVAVVDPQGTFVGAIGSDALARLGPHQQRPPATHLIAAVGELYWLGLRELFGGLSSGSRSAESPGEPPRANA